MKKLSTGQDSTLGTYLSLARLFGQHAQAFIQKKIDESPNGAEEEVLADERQMLYLLSQFMHGGELLDLNMKWEEINNDDIGYKGK